MASLPTLKTVSTKQAQIAKIAKQMPETGLRSVSHHIDLAWMREAYRLTRKDSAVGIDGQTATVFAENLEENLQSLLDRAKSGSYRAPPVRRVYIPKGDGVSTRPIGIPTFEDKVLQRAVVMLLEPIYEETFYDFSLGFRKGRSPHHASEMLHKGIWNMGGGVVLDADIQGFFDALDHKVLRDLLRKRVVDGVVVRLIGKWLRAGVMEEGRIVRPDLGSPQGGVISPVLANIYLHAVIDEWWAKMVMPRMRGKAFMVRFADDFVMVFSNQRDAERVFEVLPKRTERFGLTLHPEKTRLLRHYRPRDQQKEDRYESFNFLGFTHFWGLSRKGQWIPKRKTAKDRFKRALRAINWWLRRLRHLSVPEQARQLGEKLRGHYGYYGVVGNIAALCQFNHEVKCLWRKWLGRRSQRAELNWEQFNRLLVRHPLPRPRLRPYRRPSSERT
tara:strand:+ start:611 stop:1942 length:1332 start_codon:yes stop_codon:yes gene_type:complete